MSPSRTVPAIVLALPLLGAAVASRTAEEPGLALGDVRTFEGGVFDLRTETATEGVSLLIPDLKAHRYVVYRRGPAETFFRKVGIVRETMWTDRGAPEGTNTYVVVALFRGEDGGWTEKMSRPVSAAVRTVPKEAVLEVTTDPPGALVVVDNRPLGPSPVSTHLKPGVYSLAVSKEGFLPFKGPALLLAAGSVRRTNIALRPLVASVRVESVPTGAEIILDGASRGRAPLSLGDLPYGVHRIVAVLPDHLPSERSVVVDSAEPRTVVLTLTRKSGHLRVLSEPPGSEAVLDGQPRGRTPLLLPDVPAGPHTLRLLLEGYNTEETTVRVVPDVTNEVMVNLRRGESRLTVVTVPDGAEVMLDNRPIGSTPIRKMPVPAGPHRLTVRKPGHMTFEEIVEAATDGHIVRELDLPPLKAVLAVQSVPSGALVLLDGQTLGLTPFVSDQLSPGTFQVVVAKPGYAARTNVVVLTPGGRRELTVQLRPMAETRPPADSQEGFLSVESQPSGAEVRIDGRSVGSTPLMVSLGEGTWAVELFRPGYEPWSASVTVEAGKVRHLTTKLEPVLCTLDVTSVPSQAEVELNGVRVGLTPLTLTVKAGTYVLRVRKEGFMVWSESLTVPEGLRTLSRHVVLTQAVSSVLFTTVPPGALTYLDGRLLGVTPFRTAPFPDGTYTLRFRLEGYREWISTVTVRAGRPASFQAVLQPLAGQLVVLADPPEAVVWVDSGQVGRQGLPLTDIPPGYRRVVVRAFGHYDHVFHTLVEDGRTVTNRVRLEPRPRGQLVLDSVPRGARVRIDGRSVGDTPLSLEWPEGIYRVSFRRRGYRSLTGEVLVRGGETTAFTARLVPGSDCCLCNTWLGRPQVWYAGAVVGWAAAGYAWHREAGLRKAGRGAEADVWHGRASGLAVAGSVCLAVGVTVHLLF